MIITFCILFSILLCLVLVTGLRLRNTMRAGIAAVNPEAAVERSPNFYAPMDRLLSETDFNFLKTRPEIAKSSIARLRKERRKMFRKYLGCIAVDFSAIAGQLNAIVVNSDVSRPDLAAALVRARLIFAFAMLAVEARLLLHASGVHSLNISTSRLTEALAQMQSELRLSRASMMPA